MPTTLPGLVSALITLAACGYALCRGRTPERVAAAAVLLVTFLNVLVQDRVDWMDPQRRQLALDVVLMLILAALVSSSRRKWLIPATAAQLLSCVVGFLAPFATHVHPLALLSSENVLGYLLIASLAYGTHQVAASNSWLDSESVLSEANHLVGLYGPDKAYEVAGRHRGQARGRRRVLLDRVMLDIARRGARDHRGDTVTRWGR